MAVSGLAVENLQLLFQRPATWRVPQGVMVFPRLIHSKSAAQDGLPDRSDDELMRLAQAGSRAAFGCLVERHAQRVAALCARFVNDTQVGQELAQDTWVAVWQSRDKYQPGAGFVPWLVTVARNHCRNHLRARSIRTRHAQETARLEPEASPDQIDQLLALEHERRVRDAMTDLPEAIREALLLRYADELRYDEMARVIGTGESTLRSRVFHGLKLLRDKLEKDL